MTARGWLAALGLLMAATATAAGLPVVDVYKSPSCGCCDDWIKHLKTNGFKVRAHDTDDVVSHKYRLGVPPGYGSCHTAEVEGYLIEGHVPARGLTVPGMPIGSPGMEQGARRDPFEVLLVTPNGDTRVYARY